MHNSLYKITGYDNLPDNATNYIWVRLDPYYYRNSGVRYAGSMSGTYEEHQLSGGLSYKLQTNGIRYRFSLPSNAIVFSPMEAYTYEEENGYGYYRYNRNTYYYNGKSISGSRDDIYIGFPKSQYTNKSVSFTTYLYGFYYDYDHEFDPDRTHLFIDNIYQTALHR
jgi:hypothetical protein